MRPAPAVMDSKPPTRTAEPTLLLLKVGLVALALGVLTAFAQGWLPAQVGSLANSSGSWAMVAFLLALLAPRSAVAMGCAALALLALVMGYYAASELRGLNASTSAVVFWVLAAVVAGPPLGVSAYWVRGARQMLAAAGIGVPAGVLIGEGIYGLRYIADTTYPPYWWLEIAFGVALLCAVAVIRLRSLRLIALSLVAALTVAAAFVTIYSQNLLALP